MLFKFARHKDFLRQPGYAELNPLQQFLDRVSIERAMRGLTRDISKAIKAVEKK